MHMDLGSKFVVSAPITLTCSPISGVWVTQSSRSNPLLPRIHLASIRLLSAVGCYCWAQSWRASHK